MFVCFLENKWYSIVILCAEGIYSFVDSGCCMDDSPKKIKRGKRKLVRMAFSLITLAAFAYIVVTLISGQQIQLPRLSRLFSAGVPEVTANEYHFDVGRGRVFANLGSAVAAVGSLGIQVLDYGGAETLREPFRMSFPAIAANSGRAIAFDVDGTTVRVFDENRVITALETSNAIISASINRNGWFVVCSQDSGGFKGSAAVYNNNGNNVYRVDLASGYILSAALSPDNRSLAILSLTDRGSRIVFYSLDSEAAGNSFSLPGGLIIDMRYMSGGNVLAVTTDSLIVVNNSGEGRNLYEFSGRGLGGYSIDGGTYVLHLLDYGVGHSGQIVAISENGNLLGELSTNDEIVSISYSGGMLAILRSDGPEFFDAGFESIPHSAQPISASGAGRILALDSGAAIAYGDHSAVVFRVER